MTRRRSSQVCIRTSQSLQRSVLFATSHRRVPALSAVSTPARVIKESIKSIKSFHPRSLTSRAITARLGHRSRRVHALRLGHVAHARLARRVDASAVGVLIIIARHRPIIASRTHLPRPLSRARLPTPLSRVPTASTVRASPTCSPSTRPSPSVVAPSSRTRRRGGGP